MQIIIHSKILVSSGYNCGSAKLRMQEVTKECQWLEGRMRDNVIELKAINKRLGKLTDSPGKNEMHWLL